MSNGQYKAGTVLTTEDMIEIAREAIMKAGGVAYIAKLWGFNPATIYAALSGESKSHGLLATIVREIAVVPVGDRQVTHHWEIGNA